MIQIRFFATIHTEQRKSTVRSATAILREGGREDHGAQNYMVPCRLMMNNKGMCE